jgi:hypothetical protein
MILAAQAAENVAGQASSGVWVTLEWQVCCQCGTGLKLLKFVDGSQSMKMQKAFTGAPNPRSHQ